MGSTQKELPYWQVNVPEAEREEECPEFLRNISDKDRSIIGTPDDEYVVDTWQVVLQKVESMRLDLLQRVPSHLRRYLAFTRKLKQDYGSVLNFILTQRVNWSKPIVPRGRPFEFDDDICVLLNDWPYGIDPCIVHLVVWTKFELLDDPATGRLTGQARAEIEAWVEKTFSSKISPDRIVWFKNWGALKSIHAVEHFHVMLFAPDPDLVRQVTRHENQTEVPTS